MIKVSFSYSASCSSRTASNGKSHDGLYAFWGESFCMSNLHLTSKSGQQWKLLNLIHYFGSTSNNVHV